MGDIVSLDSRLALVGSMVRAGVRLADVGTDHGYLIGNLTLEGKILGGVACDINSMPLESAKRYIASLGLSDKITCVLSDGLKEIDGKLVDDIAIAGMGGDLITQIMLSCSWTRDKEKSFVLQPMSKAEVVRLQLYLHGFEILEEQAVMVSDKVYTVMRVVYCGVITEVNTLFSYVGRLTETPNRFTNDYLDRMIRYISKKAEGMRSSSPQLSKEYFDLASEIRKLRI